MSSNGTAGPSRFLLLGESTLCREGLAQILRSMPQAPTVDVAEIMETATGPELEAEPYDLIFVVAPAAGGDCDGQVRAVKAAAPVTPIAVLGLLDAPTSVRNAIGAGAVGYLPATASPRVIRHAVELMLSGSLYLPPSVLGNSQSDGEIAHAAHGNLIRLTARQEAVLSELAKGHSNKQIATELGLSEATVKVHVAAIMRTLKAQNRTQAVLTATQVGILVEHPGN
jgi:DNA-binding NarL/FixJ family response regulator